MYVQLLKKTILFLLIEGGCFLVTVEGAAKGEAVRGFRRNGLISKQEESLEGVRPGLGLD